MNIVERADAVCEKLGLDRATLISRFRRYKVSRFSVLWTAYGPGVERPCIIADTQFPAATLIACAGKPILEVIDHPVTRERYTAADVIERAFWDDEAQVSVFEVRRAA